METYITSKEELNETVQAAVKKLLEKELPSLLRKAKRKEWINTNELMELTGWSRRTIQYLRDKNKIPFSQEKHRILYPTEGIEEYLRSNLIEPKE
ncbi:helix-turn-helix domain-containing protein [Aliifodinibius salicampi]|uniref:Helix-turn-helix domain-containing protein n=1 Tax=Fodinibius salicampi TaxID=1920655 RepID=A0ABT3Q093_9BACT|nr:helix-turn-helix domain-containing protein [Fodinibius salicampi]MCW9713495.1 helix-turn-helix domain-containing protein [Fodinibius salicampi]